MSLPPIPAGPAPQQAIPVAPVATQLTVGQALGPDGRPLVVLQVTTPVGLACYFLDADCAVAVGGHLQHAGRVAKAGLILPSNGDSPG